MQTQIPFDLAPDALILDPFQTPGFQVLTQPEALWRSIPAGRIHGFAVSEHPTIQDRLQSVLTATQRERLFTRALQVATVPVHLTDVSFRPSCVTQGNRCLISGAAGLRLLADYGAQNASLTAHFDALQARPGPRHLAQVTEDLAPGTPFAIAVDRPTESLAQLCLVEETGLLGPIYLHLPKDCPQIRGFVAALFPELAPRVIFDRSPAHHAEVVVPYTFTASLYQLSTAELEPLEHEFPPNGAWRGRHATPDSLAILGAHAVDASLFKLRARGLRAIQGRDTSDLPKRIWITGGQMEGEEAFLDMLRLFGFQAVTLDSLAPLDQIALIAGAEMIILAQGAQPIPLIFAPSDATVIQIGTLQTALYRWSDLWPLAAVSGCRHLTFFADLTTPDLQPPPDVLLPAHLSRLGLARIMSLVVALLGEVPQFQSPQDVQILGQQLMAIGAHDRAQAVFETHKPLADGHVGLSLAMADLADHRGDKAQTLAALYCAYRADPSDWAVLIRMLWCARAMDQPDLVTTLLATLHDGFPDRFQAFARARPWVRDYFSTESA